MTESNRSKSLPRHRPAKGAYSNLRIGDRDRTIIRLLYEHRFLSTELIGHLLGIYGEIIPTWGKPGRNGKTRPARYSFGEKALYKRLQALFHGRYVERHFATDRPLGRGEGAPAAIYGIGPKSAALSSELTGVSPDEIRRIYEANKVKSPFLKHALETARFRVILELACRKSEGMVELLFWEQGQKLRDSVYGYDNDGKTRFSVYPDAFFGIHVKGKGKAQYFLEVDRGTMPIIARGNRSDIKKKILGYWYYRKAQLQTKKYFYRISPDGQTAGLGINFGNNDSKSDSHIEPVKWFRVLFSVPGPSDKLTGLKGRIANIMYVFPSLGDRFSTSTLFWFASAESFDINKPEVIFKRIWQTPNPEHELKSIIE